MDLRSWSILALLWGVLLPFVFVPAAAVGAVIGLFGRRGFGFVTCLIVSVLVSPLVDLGMSYRDYMRSANRSERRFAIEWHLHVEGTLMWQPPIFVSLLIGSGVGALVRGLRNGAK